MKVFFIAGLPRSGSTLLSALLNQNPQIHAEPNSCLLDLLGYVDGSLTQSEQAQAFPNQQRLSEVCKAIPERFFAWTGKEVIVDKNRNWTAGYAHRLASLYVSERPKIVCCVRPVLEILASYVDICRRSGGGFIDSHINTNQFFGPIDDDRCEVLMMPGGRLNHNLHCMNAILNSQYKNDVLLVEYDDLVSNPQQQMDRIYNFWGLDTFTHSNHVEEPFPVDDSVYGINGLHKLNSVIQKSDRLPSKILSPKILKKYSGLDFWRD